MSDNIKSALIRAIQCELTDKLTNEDIKIVTNTITVQLSKYDLNEKCTDIAVIETESEKIITMFLATKKIEGKSDKTIEAYKRRLDELMRVVNKPVSEMTIFDMRMYLAYKQMNGCTERTASGYRSILVSFFNWAYGEKLIPDNPVLTLGVIKYNKEIKKPFSRVELEQLRAACTSTRDRAIIETLLATGCRVGELVKIKQNDIDFNNMEIKVTGKGNKQRIVYFDAVTAMWIRKYLSTRNDTRQELFIGKRTKNAETAKPITEGTVRAMLKGVEKLSGVENVHPHRFRRTLATTLIKREMSVQEVAAILGHSNINTTMTYVYMDNLSIRAAYSKIAA